MLIGDEGRGLQPLDNSNSASAKETKELFLEGTEGSGIVKTQGYLNSNIPPEEVKQATEKSNLWGAAAYQIGAGLRQKKEQYTGQIMNFVGQSILKGAEEDEKRYYQAGNKGQPGSGSDIARTNLDHRFALARSLNTTALAARQRALLLEGKKQGEAIGKEVSTGEELTMGVTSAATSVAPFLAVAGGSLLAGPAAPVVATVGSAIVAMEMALQSGLEQFQKGTDADLDYGVNVAQASEVMAVQGVTDFVGGTFLARLWGGSVNKAIQAITKKTSEKAITFGRVATRAVGQGALVEGPVEGLQNLNQDLMDAVTGIEKDPSLSKSIRGALIATVAGAITGGAVNVGGVVVQRRKIVDEIRKSNPDMSFTSAQQVADTLIYHSIESAQKTVEERYGLVNDSLALQKSLDGVNQEPLDIAKLLSQTEKAMQPTAEQSSRAMETLLKGESQIVEAKVKEVYSEVSGKQKEVAKTQKEIKDSERELRLLKKDPLVAFKEQEGRDPKDNELSTWAMTRTASLEEKVKNLSEQSEAKQGQLTKARGSFTEALRGLPDAQKIQDIEESIAKENDKLSALSVMEDPEALKKAEAITEKIQKLEQKLVSYGRPEARVQEAEDALDEATIKLEKIDGDLQKAEDKLQAIRSNTTAAFIEEKGREPRPDELSVWKKENVAAAEKEVKESQDLLTEQLREVQNLTGEAEAYRLGLEKVTGSVSVSANLLRRKSIETIRRYQQGFGKGRRLAVKEAQGVLRATQQFISRLPISNERKVKLLKRLRVVTVDNFNKNLNVFLDVINKAQEAERVEQYRAVVKEAVNNALQSKSVSPETQKLAAHLQKVLNGTVPAGQSEDTLTGFAESNIEELKGDISEKRAEQIAQWFVGLSSEQYANKLASLKEEHEKVMGSVNTLVKGIWASKLTRKQIEEGYTEALVKVDAEGNTQIQDPRLRATGSTNERTRQIGFRLELPASVFRAMNALAEILDRGTLNAKIGTGVAYQTIGQLDKVTREWKIGIVDRLQEQSDAFQKVFGKKNTFLKSIMFQTVQDGVTVEFDLDGKDATKTLTKAETISLYLLGQDNQSYQEVLRNNGVKEDWYNNFLANPGFSEEELSLVNFYREAFAKFPDRYTPIFEKVTGYAAPVLENYFPRHRYRLSLEQEEQESGLSIIDQMMGPSGDVDLTKMSELQERKRGKTPIEIENVVTVYNRYVSHMEHFIAAAEWVQKARQIIMNPMVSDAVRNQYGEEYSAILKNGIDMVARGRPVDHAEKGMTAAFNRMLVNFGGAKLFGPEHTMRQLESLPVFLRYMNIQELVGGFLDLSRSWNTEEFKAFYDSPELRLRRVGLQNFNLSQLSELSDIQDVVKDIKLVADGKADPFTQARIMLRGARRGQAVRALIRGWVVLGDQASSVTGGWAAYKKAKNGGATHEAALDKAQEVIAATQQSMSYGRRPEMYTKTGVGTTLLNLFQQYPSQYFSEWLRLYGEAYSTVKREGWGTFSALVPTKPGETPRSRITYGDLASSLLVYFFMVPLTSAALTSVLQGEPEKTGERFSRWWMFGPLSVHGWTAEFMSAMYNAFASQEYGSAEEAYKRDMERSNILDSSERRVAKITKAFKKMMEGEEGANLMTDIMLPLGSLVVEGRTAIAVEELAGRGYSLLHAILDQTQSASETGAELLYAVTGNKKQDKD